MIETAHSSVRGRPERKRRWGRWLAAVLAALLVIVVATVVAVVKLQPVAAPLALPDTPAAAVSGPVQGTWVVTGGTTAGFRIRETVLFVGNDVVYRTNAVSGSLVVSGDRITTADFRVDLTAFTTRRGKTQPQLATSLDIQHHPDATFELTQPIALPATFASGAATTITAGGRLTLRGITRAVTITITGRRNGANLQAAGSIPVTFAEFGIPGPAGFGPLGSLDDHGTAEFLVILQH
jgi:polyisoprenoid-binding protein YceI